MNWKVTRDRGVVSGGQEARPNVGLLPVATPTAAVAPAAADYDRWTEIARAVPGTIVRARVVAGVAIAARVAAWGALHGVTLGIHALGVGRVVAPLHVAARCLSVAGTNCAAGQ